MCSSDLSLFRVSAEYSPHRQKALMMRLLFPSLSAENASPAAAEVREILRGAAAPARRPRRLLLHGTRKGTHVVVASRATKPHAMDLKVMDSRTTVACAHEAAFSLCIIAYIHCIIDILVVFKPKMSQRTVRVCGPDGPRVRRTD